MQQTDRSQTKRTRSKLTQEQVSEIKGLIAQKKKPAVIARAFGVSAWTIYDIAKGRRWASVDAPRTIAPSTPQAVRRKLSAKKRDLIFLAMLRKGYSYRELSERTGFARSTLWRALQDARVVVALRVSRFFTSSESLKATAKEFRLSVDLVKELLAFAVSVKPTARLLAEV